MTYHERNVARRPAAAHPRLFDGRIGQVKVAALQLVDAQMQFADDQVPVLNLVLQRMELVQEPHLDVVQVALDDLLYAEQHLAEKLLLLNRTYTSSVCVCFFFMFRKMGRFRKTEGTLIFREFGSRFRWSRGKISLFRILEIKNASDWCTKA